MMRLVLFRATEISNSFPSLRMSSESITTQRRKGKVKKRKKEENLCTNKRRIMVVEMVKKSGKVLTFFESWRF